MEVHVVGSEDTVIAFGLIGISGTIINEAKDAKTLLEELAKSKEYKIIIITQKLIEGIEEFIKDYRLNSENPILVDIPDEQGITTRESIKDLIRKSIGI
ncbi:MAG: V-type ATP synthase subunit F [Candidatus Helarchaeota archaeon]